MTCRNPTGWKVDPLRFGTQLWLKTRRSCRLTGHPIMQAHGRLIKTRASRPETPSPGGHPGRNVRAPMCARQASFRLLYIGSGSALSRHHTMVKGQHGVSDSASQASHSPKLLTD